MGQTHKVVFAPQAGSDLESIVRYIARQASPEVAERFGYQLVVKALSLAMFPERERVVPEMGTPIPGDFLSELSNCLSVERRLGGSRAVLARGARSATD